MSSTRNQSEINRSIDWFGIVRTVFVQVLVLLALAGAVVWYLNWSSDMAWQDFISANQPLLFSPSHHAQSQAPMQTVKAKAFCAKKA